MEISGSDGMGREFKSPDEMWKQEAGDDQKKGDWYRNGVGYWQGVEASDDGVLGGYAQVNEPDIIASEGFLNTLLKEFFPDGGKNQHLVALDCGSGIGRVTKNLLIRYFNEVDLLEPVSHFLEAARENLSPGNLSVSEDHKAANFYCAPLQEFTPDAGRYDVIWIQWCIGHLADDDFVSFFERAKAGLKPGGFFVLKENLARSGEPKKKKRRNDFFTVYFRYGGIFVSDPLKYAQGDMKELYDINFDEMTYENLLQIVTSDWYVFPSGYQVLEVRKGDDSFGVNLVNKDLFWIMKIRASQGQTSTSRNSLVGVVSTYTI